MAERGRREENERVCVLSGSDLCEALERSDTFPYCSVSSLDKLPSAWAHAANPGLNLCEWITCVLQMTEWRLVACVDWQAEETTLCCLERANWSDTGMSQE